MHLRDMIENGDKVVMIDRIVFAVLMIPFIYIGFEYGISELILVIVAAAAIRLIIQLFIKDTVHCTGMPMHYLNMDRRSFDIMMVSFTISMALSLGEGELLSFIEVASVSFLIYIILLFVFFRIDRNEYVQEEETEVNDVNIEESDVI